MENSYKILVRTPEGQRELGELKHEHEDNIKLILKKGSNKI
jgi:hypothetical protein